MSTKDKG